MIKQVLIKDFDFMVDRREFKMNNEYLDTMMTQLEGEQWRTMRNLMTPVFTSGKLKAMVPIMNKVCIGQKFCFIIYISHISKGSIELKQNYTQEKKPISGPVFYSAPPL